MKDIQYKQFLKLKHGDDEFSKYQNIDDVIKIILLLKMLTKEKPRFKV